MTITIPIEQNRNTYSTSRTVWCSNTGRIHVKVCPRQVTIYDINGEPNQTVEIAPQKLPGRQPEAWYKLCPLHGWPSGLGITSQLGAKNPIACLECYSNGDTTCLQRKKSQHFQIEKVTSTLKNTQKTILKKIWKLQKLRILYATYLNLQKVILNSSKFSTSSYIFITSPKHTPEVQTYLP